ncbi:MAG: NAD+ synthase [Pseudomonadales bacterium]|nr:NAD+ synthase [Pseudomonadales bacterium]
MAQLNPLVGDIPGNTQKVIGAAKEAIERFTPDIILFPELVLTAYPPEDLLLRPSLDRRIQRALDALLAQRFAVPVVVGYPGREGGRLYNMLAVIHEDSIVARYRKQCLPNYQVFDEKRYFQAGHEACLITLKGLPVALSICEDLWEAQPMAQAAARGARLMLNINGSPFHINKFQDRLMVLRARALEGNMPIVYVNQVGGQDELVFDGASMAVDADGELQVLAPAFEEGLIPLSFRLEAQRPPRLCRGEIADLGSVEACVYQALVLGVRDYVNKNGFRGVVLGLSGGIDSALTLALAVDALGADRVHAIMMPFTYTSRMSIEDAQQQADTLGVAYRVIPIAPLYESFMSSLAAEFAGMAADLSEQNLQARCRGVLLMAISNKKGLLVLTTGNKSEMAVGYSTLYGDMAGGFDALKDVPKMLVYRLAHYRNTAFGERPAAVIPQRVIERPPSAELAPGQVDEDNLPPYPVLDRILELYVEEDYSAHAIIAEGFDEVTVQRVLRLVDLNEYKRRQAPVGIRISKRGFGRDRRYPITSGWKIGD